MKSENLHWPTIVRACAFARDLERQLAEAKGALTNRDKQLAEASKSGIDLIARLRQQNHEHAAQRDKREAELLHALKRTPDWDRLFAEAKEKMLNEAVDWTTDPPSQKPGGWWQYTSLINRAAVVAMLIEIKALRARLAALEADGQRLDWLEKQLQDNQSVDQLWKDSRCTDDLRSAIDAAMKGDK